MPLRTTGVVLRVALIQGPARPGCWSGPVTALASELEDACCPGDRDQDPSRHCCDEQRHAQGKFAGHAKILHGHPVLVLQDEDDEQHQEDQCRADGNPDHSGPRHIRGPGLGGGWCPGRAFRLRGCRFVCWSRGGARRRGWARCWISSHVFSSPMAEQTVHAGRIHHRVLPR